VPNVAISLLQEFEDVIPKDIPNGYHHWGE
jgi:hypothetical protein